MAALNPRRVLGAFSRVPIWWEGRVVAFRALPRYQQYLAILAVALALAGLVLRLRSVATPHNRTFDEHHFVDNAHHYLLGVVDGNDHPPLGKLLMIPGLLLFGYNSSGWRFSSVVFGLQSVVVAYWLARALFRDRWAALLAAALVGADGFLISHARTGLLDGTLTCLMLWSVLLAATARSWRGVVASAVLLGCGLSVKWSAITAVVPAVAAVLLAGRVHWSSVGLFAVAPLVHGLIWWIGLRLTGQPADPAAIWKICYDLVLHHIELGKRPHELASPWYTWLVLYHPIVVKVSQTGANVRWAAEVGNPLAWFSVTALAVLAPVVAIPKLFRPVRLWRSLRGETPEALRLRGLLVLLIAYWTALVPWMVGRGTYTFMYHYLPAYAFGLILLAGWLHQFVQRRAVLVLTYFGIAAVLVAFYTPVWAEIPISTAGAELRLPFKYWRP